MPEQTNTHNQEPDPQFTQRFIDAVDSVQAYNERHTGIGGAMKGLVAMLFANVREEADRQPEVSPEEEAEMEKQLVQLLQTEDLKEAGITLFDTKAAGVKEADFSEEKSTERPSSLIMLITDGDKFEDTLYRLNPTDEQKEQAKQGVATLLSSAVSLIQAFYPNKTSEDSEAIGSPDEARVAVDHQLDLFMELNPALVSQGFANSHAYKTLSEYAARYASGTLPEYREAEALGLLAAEDKFGPSAWVKDANPEFLRNKWTSAFGLLKRMRDREEPSPYFSELFAKLRADFDIAKEWVDTVPTYDDDEHQRAYEEWRERMSEQRKERHRELRATFERQGLSKEETFDAILRADDEAAEQPPQPPKGAVSNRYVAGLRDAMNNLAGEWEKSFTLENAAYLAEQGDTNDIPEQAK